MLRSKVKKFIFLKIHLLNQWMYLLQTLQVHMSNNVEGLGNISCGLDPDAKVK